MKIPLKAITEPECKNFLKIKEVSSNDYMTIDAFIKKHSEISKDEMEKCYINYRGTEKTYKECTEEYFHFSEQMKLMQFNPPAFIFEQSIRNSIYFMKKAIGCLEFARFFTMKSALLLDIDYNVRWSNGYILQYLFRCIYFGTASTWYSNAFDNLLQAVYWGKELYTSVVDREGKPYENGWDAEKVMKFCTFQFVVNELAKRNENELRKLLTTCWSKIEEVRKWANFIKHKGGLDYQFLEPDPPFKLYCVPSEQATDEDGRKQYWPTEEKYEIKNFKSPIKIDIDENKDELVKAYKAIFECIEKTIAEINYEQYVLK